MEQDKQLELNEIISRLIDKLDEEGLKKMIIYLQEMVESDDS